MAKVEDIGKPGGWLVRQTTVGDPPLAQYFYVYELDKARAVELVKAEYSIGTGDTFEAVSQLNVHELTGYGVKPGEMKEHV